MINELRTYIPHTPGLRYACLINKRVLWHGAAAKRLVYGQPHVHRHTGRIIFRRCGGGVAHKYRYLDFTRRWASGIVAQVVRREYDPNRSAFIALLVYRTGLISYVTCGTRMYTYDMVRTYVRFSNVGLRMSNSIISGDTSCLRYIPDGATIYNVELYVGRGAQLLRSAGKHCLLVRKLDRIDIAWLRLVGGRNYAVPLSCIATIGVISNTQQRAVRLGKAGRARWLGRRPVVRGVARNPVDHAHGGGNGKKSKAAVPRTLWGKLLKWKKTRKWPRPIEIKYTEY